MRMTLKRAAKFGHLKAREYPTFKPTCRIYVPTDQICPPDGWKNCQWSPGNFDRWTIVLLDAVGSPIYSRSFK